MEETVNFSLFENLSKQKAGSFDFFFWRSTPVGEVNGSSPEARDFVREMKSSAHLKVAAV